MKFDISRDEKGNPSYVNTDNGFMMTGEKWDEDKHGWMEDQLDPREFPAIQTGRDMEYLVAEVNRLRRENFNLTKGNKQWAKAAGW